MPDVELMARTCHERAPIVWQLECEARRSDHDDDLAELHRWAGRRSSRPEPDLEVMQRRREREVNQAAGRRDIG